MPITFNCPQCGQQLTVKDEFAGKQGKCPGCKGVLTVPSGSAPTATKPAPRPVSKPVADAEVVDDEDVVDAVEDEDEDEAPRKKKGGITAKPSSRRRDEDEDEEDRPRKKRARDEEEDEEEEERPRKKKARDEEEDDEDRPSRKKGGKSSRRDEDEEEEDEEDRPKMSPKKRRAGLRKAALGAKLAMFGVWSTAAAFGLAAILALLFASMFGSLTPPKEGLITIVGIVNYLMTLGVVAGIGLRIAGSALTITTPGKNGEIGLAIACVSTAGVAVIMVLLLLFKFLEIPILGKTLLFIIATAEFDPLAGIGGGSEGGGSRAMHGEIGFAVFVLPLVEVAWLTLFALYQWSAGKSFKDKDLRSKGMLMVIVAPSTCGGMGLLMLLLRSVIKATSIWLPMMVVVFHLLVIGGMLAWYGIVVSQAKNALEDAQ
jgi:hypothetical protein